ncbi:MAG: hypothetical protein IPL61_13800 [Myxococcales bacterium]|nr:hypothetical protein [Myxococcales bacterium]
MRAALVVAALVAEVGPTAAEPPRALRLGVDGVVPFAAWDQVAGLGAGGSLTVAVAVAPAIDVTARVAVIGHAAVTTDGLTSRVLEAPIVGGVRYQVAELGRAHGFAFGEVGLAARRTTVAIANVREHDSSVGFAAAIGGGVGYGRVDLRVAAWLADLGDLDHGVGVTAAVDVALVRW